MSQYHTIGLDELHNLAFKASRHIKPRSDRPARVYGIPRGGISAALAMRGHKVFDLVDDCKLADYIVDDLIDSGSTMAGEIAINHGYGGTAEPVVLIDKRDALTPYHGKWIVFPWEGGHADKPETIQDNIRRLLQFVDPDSERGGLKETPDRVAKAWEFWCSGYDLNPASILKTFEDGAERVDEMVLVRNIPFYSHCEHHLAPIFGTATIGYVANGKIVGLSKLSRLLDCFARRLQVQERMTNQVADALMEHLQPKGAGVIVTARHLCMESRGVCQQGHDTVTSALRGVMLDGTPRSEFLALSRG